MSSEHEQPRVGIGVYVMKGGKLLIGRRRGSHGEGEYATPGGHLEHLQSFAECIAAEVLQETGMTVGNVRLVRIANIRRYRPKHYVDLAFTADWVAGEPTVMEPDKVESWAWYDMDRLPSPLFAPMAFTFEALRTGRLLWDADETDGPPVPEPEGEPFRIYFASGIRGGADFAKLRSRIEFLGGIGEAVTAHMASPRTVDVDGGDPAIYAHDQALLAASHVFIADLSRASTGTGFMAARAVARGLPTLCLYPDDQQPSAMIAGCPEIALATYADEEEFVAVVRAFLLANARRFIGKTFRGRTFFVAGPPGAGKGTLGRILADLTGMVHVSTGDLLRALDPAHPQSEKINAFMAAGELVPASIMRDLVLERLARPDVRLFGLILDGYPPSRDDLEVLRGGGIKPDLVFSLECDDAVALARQVGRGQRSTDTRKGARKRLEAFQGSGPSSPAQLAAWFPGEVVARVDAARTVPDVAAFAREALSNLFGPAERAAPYFVLPPARAEDVRSTRRHFHIDAPNATVLREIARRIHARHKAAQGQIKIYPVRDLALGPQVLALPELYGSMPNFRPIKGARDEAFITGRLGEGDPVLMRIALEEGLGQGCMVELEEYLGEWTLDLNGEVCVDAAYERLPADPPDLDRGFEEFWRGPLPAFELHLGFNLHKEEGVDMPVSPSRLVELCTEAGFQNGGWFVFNREREWAYRSNEFSYASAGAAAKRLFGQAFKLRELLLHHLHMAARISFSLEIVHGIWANR